MSAIYFHTKERGDVRLSGRERAWMGYLVTSITCGFLRLDLEDADKWLPAALPDNHYLRDLIARDGPYLSGSIRTAIANGDLILNTIEGKIDSFTLCLNTALALGNDQIKLAARLHGQCEIHCRIENPDKPFISNIIARGLEKSIFRINEGWENVLTLLDDKDAGPIVCSYSVCERFPNFGCLPSDHPLMDRDDEERFEEFYEIDKAEQWDLCLKGLKERTGYQIRKSDWNSFSFDPKMNALRLRKSVERLAASLAAAS